jgi:hypothetical protein
MDTEKVSKYLDILDSEEVTRNSEEIKPFGTNSTLRISPKIDLQIHMQTAQCCLWCC